MFSFVFRPFCWPMTTTGSPSSFAKPPTMAWSAANRRSPSTSKKSVKMSPR
jgi:hypothetical protein